ncbi:MAG: DUF3786 domain-containing protein [Spirochaetaceae bacterium]|jgi:hypothetical protein|nr:DUF3786 domain-containing protein [Spirochaetaceae bacterium]
MVDWKERVTLAHYLELFARLDPVEAAQRCNLHFNSERFSVRLLGVNYQIYHPSFDITPEDAVNNDGHGDTLTTNEKILLARYLCEGCWKPSSGNALSYREVPWGELYFRNFEARCIRRLARAFGQEPELFIRVFEDFSEVYPEKKAENHPAYRFEFISNFSMCLHLWPGDDEFPPSAQILFDDNMPGAFTAEDLAVVGDVVIDRLKKRALRLAGR